jgi:hypothetical protein
MVAELFKKHMVQTKQFMDVEEVRANVRKEDRIIDALEPVMNQHRLIVDRKMSSNGTLNLTLMKLLKNVSSTCSSIRCLVCVEKKVPLNMTIDLIHYLKVFNTLLMP